MSIVLYRVDERLIHGQVVVGWGAQLRPDRIVVIDDELAGSQWEQDLYRLGVPPGMSSDFATVEAARASVSQWERSAERVIVLTRDVATMLRLAHGGLLDGAAVNIGGIHHAPSRRQILPYVYLSAAEAAALRSLADEGARVTARDLPDARSVDVSRMLEEADS